MSDLVIVAVEVVDGGELAVTFSDESTAVFMVAELLELAEQNECFVLANKLGPIQ